MFDRIRNSQFFGVIVDEPTVIFALRDLVVFATFIQDGAIICVF